MQGLDVLGLFLPLFVVLLALGVKSDDYYSSYYGVKLTSAEVTAYTSNGTLANCTNVVATCNSTEPRRVDGTCNNLNHPSVGATRTPYYRVLRAQYNVTAPGVYNPRLSKNGTGLNLARKIRTTLVADGRIEDDTFTQCATHFAVFFATDITNTRDTSNYVTWRPYCCAEAGKKDLMCAPNLVPDDDYVHRYSGIQCLNMTRPFTYQTSGCLANTTTPLRIVDATPVWDLSPIYGNVIETGRRTYVNGTLSTETINGTVFPPTSGISLLLGVNFFGIIFFWRFHNHIAAELAKVNPTWTDEQLYSTAREINIACSCQIFYYELMGLLMGTDNLIADGVLSECSDFRDLYDETVLPQMSLEFPVALRWMHKMQDGVLKFYNTEGEFMNKTFPMVNLTTNIGFLKQANNMNYITQGCFRQPSGKVDDHVADPDILNLGLGGLQRSNDIMTNDLAKNRYFGFQPYIKYLEYCFGYSITSFDDLEVIIDHERIDALKGVYVSVEDIDLLAGIWVEGIKSGSNVPPTFYCLVKEQLLRNIKSDRHWYERDTRPNAFTSCQLAQIRNVTAARMLCDIGDSVTKIQPSIFQLPSTYNAIVSCDEIPNIDYTAWSDDACSEDYDI